MTESDWLTLAFGIILGIGIGFVGALVWTLSMATRDNRYFESCMARTRKAVTSPIKEVK